jgi:hypothetical protein
VPLTEILVAFVVAIAAIVAVIPLCGRCDDGRPIRSKRPSLGQAVVDPQSRK